MDASIAASLILSEETEGRVGSDGCARKGLDTRNPRAPPQNNTAKSQGPIIVIMIAIIICMGSPRSIILKVPPLPPPAPRLALHGCYSPLGFLRDSFLSSSKHSRTSMTFGPAALSRQCAAAKYVAMW